MSFDVDFALRIGEIELSPAFSTSAGLTVLFGPSGAGKTTVLNVVAGLVRPPQGRVTVNGKVLYDAAAGVDLPAHRRRAGYVFQEPRLFPHLSVRQNLFYGAARGSEAKRIDPQEMIEVLGLAPLLDRRPRSLSGGEARRVAIGRALMSDPSFLLLDEPLASLDRARREEIMRMIEHLRDHLALPILMVTHDAGEAERLASHIIPIDRP